MIRMISLLDAMITSRVTNYQRPTLRSFNSVTLTVALPELDIYF